MADKPNISKEGYVAQLVRTGVWATPQNPIQYAFLEQKPAYMGNMPAWAAFSPAQRTAAQQAFAMIAEVVNLTFVQVADNQQQPGPANPRINFYANSSDLSFSGSMLAYRIQEGPEIHGADIRLNTSRIAQRQNNEGWQDFTSFVALHEVLHAMGLSHPGNYNGQGPTYQDNAEFVEDTVQYSVMSYFAALNTGADHTLGNVLYGGRTPLLYDILALQSLYAPNMATRAGDTVYGFNSNTGANSPFNFAVTVGPVVAIWDAGGIDTIDLSGYSTGSLIDLNQGAFSDAGGLTKNIAIAFNVTIENAVGGPGQDRLFGNGVANRLDGGAGADHMEGALGDDVYLVDNSGDVVAEAGDAGRDEVRTALATYALAANVEVLTGTSPAAQTLTGNGLANTITGGAGDDSISGGAGNDVLEGGAGNGDTAVYAGNFADYEITGTTAIRDLNAADGDDGTDSLNGIEFARFADRIVQLGVDTNNPPVLGEPAMVDQIWADGHAAAYIIPGTSFVDPDGQHTLAFRATLADGSALPAWLSFDAATRTFSGTPPLAAVGATLAIRVTVDDGKVAIFDDFTIGITQAPGADINGTDGNDVLEGTFRAERMVGHDGDDVLRGSPGADILHGFSGTDQVDYGASPGGVTINLATGFASGGHAEGDQLFAFEGATGSSHADRITGTAGNDVIDGGAGADTMEGGGGADLYFVDDAGDSVVERENEGTDEVRTSLSSHVLADNVERLIGLSGTGQALSGNALANVIVAGAGDDRLDGGGGADSLAGGLGNDIYFVEEAGNTVAEAANAGIDEVRTGLAAYALTADVETLTGLSAAGQALTGNGLANIITGAGGNDTLDGGEGADQLAGGLGDDIYFVDSGDSVSEAANAGTDEVRTMLAAYTLGAEVEKLTGNSAAGQALTGNGLANLIAGGSGNDVLDGAAGADQLAGGLGDDIYYVDSGDSVGEAADAGTDEVRTGLAAYTLTAEVERLTGTSAAGQALTGNSLANLITGGSGTDVLDGAAGSDQLSGGLGDDVYLVGAGDSILENGEGGTDEVRTALAAYTLGSELERLTAISAIGQALTGNGLANVIAGAGGDDVLDGGAGADQLAGGAGDDLYFIGEGDTVTEAESAGSDEVRTTYGDTVAPANVEKLTGLLDTGQTLYGNALDNVIAGGAGADRFVGGLGNDLYLVGAGDNVIEKVGEGVDEVSTALAAYTLTADVENLTGISGAGQVLTGNAANNLVNAGSGNDVLHLWAGGGDDSVNAGAGMDNIFFGATLTSADVVTGGAGVDTLVVQGPYGSLTLTANITQIENVSILGGNNINFGEPGTNRYDYVLTTHDSNFAAGVQARINGAALLEGEDFTFDGSAETDAKFVVYGGKGKDTLTGGLGNDIFFYAEDRFASGDTVNGGAGYDGMFLRGNYTIDFNAPGYTGLFSNIENLTLTSATDERYARGGGTEFDYNLTLSDAIVGAGQLLTVSGALLMATETMVLDGSGESDGRFNLFGGQSADTLKGGALADIIHGNFGADILAGGGGADAFRYQAVTESYSVARDHIIDFTPGTDKIELDRIDANDRVGGDQAFAWIGSNAFSNTAGELRATQQGGQWIVEGDINGDGYADLIIALTLQGPTSLGAGDFVL